MKDLKWNATDGDFELIEAIAKRMCKLDILGNKIKFLMDITACHLNGCKLDLLSLLTSDVEVFRRETQGILINLNRRTGKLINGFKPFFKSSFTGCTCPGAIKNGYIIAFDCPVHKHIIWK